MNDKGGGTLQQSCFHRSAWLVEDMGVLADIHLRMKYRSG